MEIRLNREKIIRARYVQGMKRSALARKAGVCPTTVANIEKGIIGTAPETAQKICSALGLEVNDVIEILKDNMEAIGGGET